MSRLAPSPAQAEALRRRATDASRPIQVGLMNIAASILLAQLAARQAAGVADPEDLQLVAALERWAAGELV